MALANFLATPEEIKTNIYEYLQTVEQHDQLKSKTLKVLALRRLCLPKVKTLASLLLSNTHESTTQTNSDVITPLFKTSLTDITALLTELILTKGISAFVFGPDRKTIIMLELDLYNHALRIQQTAENTNWILRAVVLHIVFAALHALGKIIDGSGFDLCSYMWNLW